MAAVMSAENDALGCVMVPVGDIELLLPNVTIAEVLPWRRVKPIEGAPGWCLGLVGWRGESIPVVRFELMNGTRDRSRRTGRCLAIMNRAAVRDGLAFYAMAVDGLPRLVHIGASDVAQRQAELGPVTAMAVQIGTEQALVPNLERIEVAVAALAKRLG